MFQHITDLSVGESQSLLVGSIFKMGLAHTFDDKLFSWGSLGLKLSH